MTLKVSRHLGAVEPARLAPAECGLDKVHIALLAVWVWLAPHKNHPRKSFSWNNADQVFP
jgi:hypothetical protein